MKNTETIGNYPTFRPVMPVNGVDYPRVTNPFATALKNKQACLEEPFDLHALSTPPAFILS